MKIYIKDHKTIAQSEKLQEGRKEGKKRRGKLKRVAQPRTGDLGETGTWHERKLKGETTVFGSRSNYPLVIL